MKRNLMGLFLSGLVAAGLLTGCGNEKKPAAPAAKAPAQTEAKGPLTLEYTFNKKEGKGTNQMAAWIEDKDGKLVRTLFATRYTTQKGYKKQALPQWVKKSGLAQLDKAKVDALTKATPRSWSGYRRLGRKR